MPSDGKSSHGLWPGELINKKDRYVNTLNQLNVCTVFLQ